MTMSFKKKYLIKSLYNSYVQLVKTKIKMLFNHDPSYVSGLRLLQINIRVPLIIGK
jgi:phage head maturation protease